MWYLTKQQTEADVLQHFESLEINGVGYETTTPKVVWVNGNKYSRQYLTFIAQEGGTFGFSGTDYYDDGETKTNQLYYSLDNGETWTLLDVEGEIEVSSGDTVMWKGLGSVEQEENPSDAWGIGTFNQQVISLLRGT